MKRLLLFILFLMLIRPGFAQKGKDTIVYNLPVVNGKLLYTDTIAVKGADSTALDSKAKTWFNSYFKNWQADTIKGKGVQANILRQGIIEYHVAPGLISIPFYLVVSVQINCSNGAYSYRLHNIRFRPKNGVVNAIGYQADPEFIQTKTYRPGNIYEH
ncbi:hypothetical protein [Mucilaginibacter sp. FT3.2]|uniref:hypothetical protein n=1 Tax=Mucilaginibacter sp. FT3.2 TaxID=2723090 RepID=UPI00161919F6|nr:hypothetical protein [Mucilaginibacter sp. FT3.2]MBB6233130.1 hypothetical protein [Mucilaginibacter sp. FT3.2]